MQKFTLPQATIDGWKGQYGAIHKLSVTVKPAKKDGQGRIITEADTAVGYIKDVNEDMDMIANIVSMQASNKILECKIFLLENAWLGGDPRIHSVNPKDVINSIKMGAAVQAGNTIDMLTGNVEKL